MHPENLKRLETMLAKVEPKLPETPLADVLLGNARREIRLHEHSLVALVDVMPRLVPQGMTCDTAIVQAARVSYGQGTKKVLDDRDLIRYLVRQRHTSPLEQIVLKFHHVLPIFLARQLVRHRTASLNELSGRYSVLPDRFFRPDRESLRQQSARNKQGGEGTVDDLTADLFYDYLDKAEALYQDYKSLADSGVARELARIGLPLSLYTEWYWSIDLHNLFHCLSLRMDSHAQSELQDIAWAMFALVEPLCPWACEAFLDYRFESLTLSRLEVEAIRDKLPLDSANKREQDEFAAKMTSLDLDYLL